MLTHMLTFVKVTIWDTGDLGDTFFMGPFPSFFDQNFSGLLGLFLYPIGSFPARMLRMGAVHDTKLLIAP